MIWGGTEPAPQPVSCDEVTKYSGLNSAMPEGFVMDSLVVPANGIHYYKPPTTDTSPTGNWMDWVYGEIDGKLAFFEPMFAAQKLKQGEECR